MKKYFILTMLIVLNFSANLIYGNINNEIREEIDILITEYNKLNKFIGAVLVAKDGEIIISKGYGMADIAHNIPNTPETAFRLGSVSKQFTAAAILQLYDKGLLDIYDPISNYIPFYPNGDKITIHNLLNHTSGIPSLTDFEDFDEYMKIDHELDEILEYFMNKPLEFTPGEQFKYSNSGYIVLTKIIEIVSDQQYQTYMFENIFQPLVMQNSGLDDYYTIIPNMAEGYVFYDGNYMYDDYVSMSIPLGAGGLYSTIDDLYKWDRALYNSDFLSDSSKNLMFSKTVLMDSSDSSSFYGYGWGISEEDNKVKYSHSGGIQGYISYIARYPDDNMTIIILSNNIFTSLGNIRKSIFSILTDKPYDLPEEIIEIELDPSIFEKYTGVYRLSNDMEFIILIDNNKYFIQGPDGEQLEIHPKSEISFFITEIDISLDFIIEDNIVTGLILNQIGSKYELEKIE